MPLAVCATPIGNLDDVTLRVLAELREADLVLCEDTRRTRILLDRHGIEARPPELPPAQRGGARRPRCSRGSERGERVALVSDAGLPGVNDPGARLIAAAIEAGVPVTVLPGPSAVETALVASGLVGERYQFVGYLPRRAGELRALAEELAPWPHAVVAFESPRRLPASLAVLAEAMAERPAAVCRELTKRFEEVVRGTLAELAAGSPSRRRARSRSCSGSRGRWRARRLDDDAAAAVAELVAAGVRRRRPRRARGAADRHPAKRALPRLSVTTSSIRCRPRPTAATLDLVFARTGNETRGRRRRVPGWMLLAAPDALAWAWPADGAVLRGYSVGDNPYAGGQHRGIDIALDGADVVRAPASGEVSFAGRCRRTVSTVTILTATGTRRR